MTGSGSATTTGSSATGFFQSDSRTLSKGKSGPLRQRSTSDATCWTCRSMRSHPNMPLRIPACPMWQQTPRPMDSDSDIRCIITFHDSSHMQCDRASRERAAFATSWWLARRWLFSAAACLRSSAQSESASADAHGLSAADEHGEPCPNGVVFVVGVVACTALEAPHHFRVVRPAEHVGL